ncbi:MAG: hypothetical protein J5879_06885 [Clostridia bacterium]|nr:hypothetical protein [Clostridia bacterium]
MSLHQIIHTSRKCGLYGGAPGFGILSSDRDFPRPDEFGELLYEYKAPEIETVDPEYSEKLIACMPVSFTYRYVNGSCAVTRSGCLGSDPISGGMNHISHSILLSETDFNVYPCDFIDSPSFIKVPSAEAVNSEKGVGYVGAPVLAAGTAVNVNKVMKFLSLPGYFGVFRNMLWALIHKEDAKRRIIICDTQENTALWIAALLYALPLTYAKKISFTTYAYDPRKADVDICGVVSKCTAYDRELFESDGFFVFDLTSGDCFDPGTFSDEAPFFEFIEETMLHNYDLLKVFHTYIELFCDTDRLTAAICPAYLMSRASNCFSATTESFKSVSEADFDRISEYSGRHARYGGKLLLTEAMLCVGDAILGFGQSYVTKILGYMSAVYKDASLILQNGFRALATDSVPIAMIARDVTSGSFNNYFENVRKMTAFCSIDITDELMADKSRSALLYVANQHVEWKPDFIVSLISEYIHKHGCSYECLSPADKIGAFLSSVMKERYACGNDKAASVHALSLFTDDVKRFCTVEENLETVSDNIPDGLAIQVNVVTAFSELAAANMSDRRKDLFNFLAASEKYDLMWATLRQMITTYDVKQTSQLLSEHYTGYFTASQDYSQTYLPEALGVYYENYKQKKPENIKEAEELIFGILLSERRVTDISDDVVNGIISRIKLGKPNKEAEKTINDLYEYECNVRKKELSGKLLCLAFGVTASGIGNRMDYHNAKPYLTSLTSKDQVDLTSLTDNEAQTYQSWVLPLFAESVEVEEIPYVYSLFRFTTPQSKEFVECFCDEWLNRSKHESSYAEFCTFLQFVFGLGEDELQSVGEKVNRLNSKKLEQLKLDAETEFSKDFAVMEKFNRMLEIQPKKKGFFGLFKKQ